MAPSRRKRHQNHQNPGVMAAPAAVGGGGGGGVQANFWVGDREQTSAGFFAARLGWRAVPTFRCPV